MSAHQPTSSSLTEAAALFNNILAILDYIANILAETIRPLSNATAIGNLFDLNECMQYVNSGEDNSR